MNPLKFVGVARAIAQLSKDPSVKVGALAVADDGTILAGGYNGFPRGVDDDIQRYRNRGYKLKLVSHAEANVVAQAARKGIKLFDSNLILTARHPCSDCSKLIVQSGIRRVFAPVMAEARSVNPDWEIDLVWARIILEEGGVLVEHYSEEDYG